MIEADISIRIKRIENTKARKKTKGKRTSLVHQRGEYAGSATGAPGSLDSASASLHDLEEALDRNKADVEIRIGMPENPDLMIRRLSPGVERVWSRSAATSC